MTHDEAIQRRREIAAYMLQNGGNVADAARRFDVSVMTVRYACNDDPSHPMSIFKRRKERHERDAKIVKLANQDETMEAIVEKVGCCMTTVQKSLQRAGVASGRRQVEKNVRQRIERMGKRPCLEIARHVGCSPMTAWRWRVA